VSSKTKKEIGTHIFFKLNFTAINSLFLVLYTAAMGFPPEKNARESSKKFTKVGIQIYW
jgi:hypothetical protein